MTDFEKYYGENEELNQLVMHNICCCGDCEQARKTLKELGLSNDNSQQTQSHTSSKPPLTAKGDGKVDKTADTNVKEVKK